MFLCGVFMAGNAFGAWTNYMGTCKYVTNLSSLGVSTETRLDVGNDAGYICATNIGEGKNCPPQTTFVTTSDVYTCLPKKNWAKRTSSVKDCTYNLISDMYNKGGIIKYGNYLLQDNSIFSKKDGDVYMSETSGIYIPVI